MNEAIATAAVGVGDGAQTPAQRRPTSPYPGLRPFEPDERDLFFGRDRDAELLSNKILASRLTLLFGQSGRGKSSLLRTLLMPRLEREEARVVAFDDWATEAPLAAILGRLAPLLGTSDGSGPGSFEQGSAQSIAPPSRHGRNRTLADLARRLTAYDPRPLVIVFDQFEELLQRQSGSVETVRRELAALVRDQNSDVRILIGLREEFLASLEPFRRDIPSLFDSTYRLEPLSEADVRDAIVKPAASFGVVVDPALVDRLLHDLQGDTGTPTGSTLAPGAAATGAPAAERAVDLPMLQLALTQLWEEAVRTHSSKISDDLYQSLGGLNRIAAGYVESVMPASRRDRVLTARLLQHLAPSSGYKVSFSADDLAAVTELNGDRIKAELQRLSRAGIIRLREFRDKRLYELQHDAFIAVLTPWRDEVLRQSRQFRSLVRSAAGGVIALVLLIAASGVAYEMLMASERDRFEEARTRQITEANLLALDSISDKSEYEREAPNRIDEATRHLLYEARGPERIERLARMLKTFERHIPVDHGLYHSGKSKSLIEQPPTNWPFALEVARGRNLQSDRGISDAEALLHHNWREKAIRLIELWGIPVPLSLRIESNEILNRNALRLRNSRGDEIRVNVPLLHDNDLYAVISRDMLRGPAREFFDHFVEGWRPLPALDQGKGAYFAAPRWTLPVWKVAGYSPTDGTNEIALNVANAALQSPSILLTDEVVELLLRRLSKDFPETVAEVRAARGARFRSDLIALVKEESSLHHLEFFLDWLVRHSSEDSVAAARRFKSYDAYREGWAPPVLAGPREAIEPPQELRPLTTKAFEEATPYLPVPDSRNIRIYLGKDANEKVSAIWDVEGGMASALQALRDRFVRRFGIEPFPIRFRPASSAWPVSANAFRVAVLNQGVSNEDTREISVPQDQEDLIPRLSREIERVTTLWRPFFITAERIVQVLANVEPDVARWLKTRFSITDIKLLLRSVIGPSEDEIDGSSSPADKTVRHADWLLPALVFFEPAVGLNTAELTRGLRELQLAMARVLAGSPQQAAPPAIDRNIVAGIDALLSGEVDRAQGLFGDAARRKENWAAFIQGYAHRFPEWRLRQAENSCRDLTRASLNRDARLDLEDLLNGELPVSSDRLQLKLCLYDAYRRDLRHRDADRVLADISSAHGNIADWKPGQAEWLGRDVFRRFDSSRDSRERFSFAVALLELSVQQLAAPDAIRLFNDLTGNCSDRRRHTWCTELLDRLADARPADLALDRAIALSFAETLDDAEKSLRYLERHRQAQLLDSSSPPPARIAEFAQLARVNAQATLASFNRVPNWAPIEQDYRSLIASGKESDVLANAYVGLIQTLLSQERYAEAIEQINNIPDQSRKVGEATFDSLRWNAAIGGSNPDEVRLAAAILVKRSGDAGYERHAALAAVISRLENWREMAQKFILGTHSDRELVGIIFASMSIGDDQRDAQEFLEGRWSSVRTDGWTTRLRDGDPGVWYEMLLGHYLGKPEVSRGELLAALSGDEAFAAAKFSALPLARSGMLCEFYFYDALKAKTRGNREDAVAGLQASISTGHTRYTEFVMAKYLLGQEARR